MRRTHLPALRPVSLRSARLGVALSLLVLLSGCAQLVRRDGFGEVQTLVGERGLAQDVAWHDEAAARQQAESAVATLLARELTADAAVQLALLNNPGLQATYEDLGVAQADLVQAGLLENPRFTGAMLFGGVSPTYDFDVAQSFLELLLLPARKRIAGAQFEQARLRVAGEVFGLAAKVRAAFYHLQGREQLVEVLELVDAAQQASLELAEALHRAGNLADLQLASERALREDVRAELLRARAETVEPREELRELLGLSHSDLTWTATARLPGLPKDDPELGTLLSRAHERRLELAAARREETVLRESLDTTRAWRYLGSLELGADTHREQGEKNWVSGPSLSLDLPIFDQRQAEIFRLESQLRQSERRTESLEQQVAAEVRRAYGDLESARELAEHYRRSVLPARRRVVAQSQDFYNHMLLGAFDLLSAKRTEIEGYADYIGAVEGYWIARSELEKAVGERLALGEPVEPVSAEVAPPAAPAGHEHHGGH